jgi:glycosyltransferase involved in cell wall biosynthesis
MSHWVVYRGPLERSRLSFLLQALVKKHLELHFIWIFPGNLTEQRLAGFNAYIKTENLASVHIINEPLKSYLKTRRKIRQIIDKPLESLTCVGFSSLWFSSGIRFKKLVWCVNGIPEEKELTGNIPKLFTKLNWLTCRLFSKPDLIIVVSDRMERLVRGHMGAIPILNAPTCVNIQLFRHERRLERKYFTYLGTGAAWQGLDLLSFLWQAIHQQDKSVEFRVISRDPRARILATNIADENINFVSSDDFKQVAKFLNEGEVGFLVRRDTIVNRVSFPTKLAEYLAAGSWVVSSDFDWQVKDYIQKFECGFLLDPTMDFDQAANQILRFGKQYDRAKMKMNINQCADSLDRELWINRMVEKLNELS